MTADPNALIIFDHWDRVSRQRKLLEHETQRLDRAQRMLLRNPELYGKSELLRRGIIKGVK